MLSKNKKYIYLWVVAFSVFISACTPKVSIKSPSAIKPPPSLLSHLPNKTLPFKVFMSSSKQKLKVGQFLKLQLRSLSEGYVHLYTISSSGKVGSLLQNIPVSGGQTLHFPDTKAVADYQLGLPAGTETYILLVSRTKLYWISPKDRLNHNLGLSTLNLDKTQLIHRLRQVTSKLSKDDWNIAYLQLPLLK